MSDFDVPKDLDEQEWIKEGDSFHKEAPLSLHIDGYYKGFHTGITLRFDNNEKVPTKKIETLIDNMIARDWEPSWNKDTSKQQLNGKVKQAKQDCQHPPDDTVVLTSHTEKNDGRKFKKCEICGDFLGWVS